MFVFLTALKHPDTASDWDRVTGLFQSTVHSLRGQKTDFILIVVCNQMPVGDYPEWVRFHLVDFPPVERDASGKLAEDAKFLDKGAKYIAGLLFAAEFDPTYLYIIDSDDWINIEVTDFFQDQSYPVWYVHKGYWVDVNSNTYKMRPYFYRYCGTSFVYDYSTLMSTLGSMGNLTKSSSLDDIDKTLDSFVLRKVISNHVYNYNFFREKGVTPKEIPFAAATWNQGTGENVSLVSGGPGGLKFDAKFINDFHLEQTHTPSQNSILQKTLDLLTYFAQRLRGKWRAF